MNITTVQKEVFLKVKHVFSQGVRRKTRKYEKIRQDLQDIQDIVNEIQRIDR